MGEHSEFRPIGYRLVYDKPRSKEALGIFSVITIDGEPRTFGTSGYVPLYQMPNGRFVLFDASYAARLDIPYGVF